LIGGIIIFFELIAVEIVWGRQKLGSSDRRRWEGGRVYTFIALSTSPSSAYICARKSKA